MSTEYDSSILNNKISYLDDNTIYLERLRIFFKDIGCNIEIYNSPVDAMIALNNHEKDIFLCDLRLDNFKISQNGKQILQKIRETNENIFLALFTAFSEELSTGDKEFLLKNKIFVYDKGDDDLFALQLHKDYVSFLKERANKPKDENSERILYVNCKNQVIDHLKNISNQKVNVPIPGHNDVEVNELINEVIKETEIGKTYINEWFNTIVIIQKFRKMI